MRISPAYLAPASMLLTVLAGVAWGIAGTRVAYRLIDLCPVAALVALALLVVTWCRSSRAGPAGEKRSAWAGGLACYSAALILADPVLWLDGVADAVITLLLVVPLVVGLNSLVHLRAWLAASGNALFLAAWVALLVHNASIRNSGRGFLIRWAS